ncbi:MAG: hypothetical protein KDB14_06495 [Planctomycetales bacterium]|nr:hypothetical protein [Planctomycetales bacterium]
MNSSRILVLGLTLLAHEVSGQPIAPPNGQPAKPDSDGANQELVGRIRRGGGEPVFRGGKLVRVGFYEPKGEDHSFPFLAELADLETLDINNTHSAAWARHVAKLKHLTHLLSYRGSLDDEACRHLKELQQLRELSLDVNKIGNVGIAELSELPNLETLRLRLMPVSREGLVAIARMPKLKLLSLVNIQITPADVLALRDSSIEELVWWVDPDYEHRALLPYVGQLHRIKRLDLSIRTVHDHELKMIAGMKGLEQLNLTDHRLTDAGLTHLSQLTSLKNLSLGLLRAAPPEQRLGDAGLQHLRPLTNLRSLGLRHSGVTDAGLPQLAELPHLNALSLGNTSITDAGVAHLQKFPELNTLGLDGTDITPAAMATLERLPHLEVLDITRTKLKDAEQLDFRRFPKLKHVVAYEFDDRKMLAPEGCRLTTFDD